MFHVAWEPSWEEEGNLSEIAPEILSDFLRNHNVKGEINNNEYESEAQTLVIDEEKDPSLGENKVFSDEVLLPLLLIRSLSKSFLSRFVGVFCVFFVSLVVVRLTWNQWVSYKLLKISSYASASVLSVLWMHSSKLTGCQTYNLCLHAE